MKKPKQSTIFDETKLITQKDNVFIYKENPDIYYFESKNLKLDYFLTLDYLEAVSALMRLKDMSDFDHLWDIEITNQMREHVTYSNCLYWLTGGDREWNKNGFYKKEWNELVDLFTNEYTDILIKINKKSKTLGDVKKEFLRYMNLPTIYEFSLKNNIVK